MISKILNIYDFHGKIQRIFIDSFDEWNNFEEPQNADDGPSLEDKFEEMAMKCADRVMEVASRTRNPKALLADNLLKVVMSYVKSKNDDRDVPVLRSIHKILGDFAEKLLQEAENIDEEI